MTRTGKSPRLSAHCSEPYIAIHPADARALSVDADTLVEIASEWGRLITRAVHEPGQRRGEIFMPIHWNDEFAANARVDSLVNPVADPLSGEPEFKHTPVRVRPWPVAWYGFLFTREHIRPGSDAGTDYWVRIRERDCWRMELAGRNSHNNRSLWARRLLGAVQPGNDRLEFTDPKAGNYRFARIDDDRLTACLFIAPAVTGLPERNWLAGLFTKPALTTADRRALLAGREPGGMDPGTTVCACHGIGRNTLLRAITIDGLKTIDMLGEKLRAGTNCGACLPELRHMIDNAAPSV
jgi:assimilatory nitrate reductase catalytic subunit